MQQACRTNNSLVCPLLTRTATSSWSRVLLASCYPPSHPHHPPSSPHCYANPQLSLSSPLTRSAVIVNPPRVRDYSASSTSSAVKIRFLGSKEPKSLKSASERKQERCRQVYTRKTMFVRVDILRNWTKDPNRFTRSDHHVLGPYFEDDVFFNRKWDM
jgi:hypothetical protein